MKVRIQKEYSWEADLDYQIEDYLSHYLTKNRYEYQTCDQRGHYVQAERQTAMIAARREAE